jgi:hypothetical protein
MKSTFRLKFFNIILALVLAVATILATAIPVFAVATPTYATIGSYKVFQNVAETGDALFLCYSKITFSSLPTATEPANFLFSLYGTSGINLIQQRANTVPASFIKATENSIYNINSLYFTAAQVTSSLVWDSEYYIKTTGSPTVYVSMTEGAHKKTVRLSASDYIDGTTSVSRNLLRDYIITTMTTMQTETGVTGTGVYLATSQIDGATVSILTAAGRTIISSAIPGIGTVCPTLFSTANNPILLNQPTATGALQSDWSISNIWGTSISNAFNGVGTYLGMSGMMFAGLFWALIICIVISVIFASSGNNTAALLLTLPFVGIGLYSGFIPIALVLTFAFLMVILVGYYIFLRGM